MNGHKNLKDSHNYDDENSIMKLNAPTLKQMQKAPVWEPKFENFPKLRKGSVSLVVNLQHDLLSALDDVSASLMNCCYLISNNNHT